MECGELHNRNVKRKEEKKKARHDDWLTVERREEEEKKGEREVVPITQKEEGRKNNARSRHCNLQPDKTKIPRLYSFLLSKQKEGRGQS